MSYNSNSIVTAWMALKTYLQTLMPECTVQRSYDPLVLLDSVSETDAPLIVIGLDGRQTEKETNGGMYRDSVDFTLMLFKKTTGQTDAETLTELDALVPLVERLVNGFSNKRVEVVGGTRLVFMEGVTLNGEVYNIDWFQQGAFVSFLQVEVQLFRKN